MEKKTQFRLNLNGIVLDLEGDRAFVEEMYKEIMRDIEEAKRRNERVNQTPAERKRAKRKPKQESVLWIHRCSPLVHKIYMASPDDLEESPILSHIDHTKLGTLYIDHALLSKLMPQFDRGQTLWAELTPAGRERIANAQGPKL